MQTYATLQAYNSLPFHRLEQHTWFAFTGRYMPDFTQREPPLNNNVPTGYAWWGITDTTPQFGMRPSAYAFQQWATTTCGAEFNEWTLPPDAPGDYLPRAMEYSDSAGGKFWVAWVSENNSAFTDTLRVPARTDSVYFLRTAYDNSPPQVTVSTQTDGWLPAEIGRRPVIIRERGTPRRPDLIVDSVWTVPAMVQQDRQAQIWARVKNIGNDSTRTHIPEGGYPAMTVRFYVDSGYVGLREYCQGIRPESSVVIGPVTWLPAVAGPRLLSVKANQTQAFVELGTDDNSGHVRTVVRVPPQSNVAPVTGGRSCVPRVILNLSSISFENDSVACESLQLLQAMYGTGDTVPDIVIASGWFGAKPCTTWQFLAGEGRYRLGLLASDDLVNISDTAWSDFVVFDSTPPPVSVAVNSDEAFTNDASVLASWAGTDSLSPACSVRLGNAALDNVVAGSGFGTGDTLWRYSGAQADGPSGMVSLAQGTDTAAVWQPLPKAVYESLVGRYVRLSADVLVEEVGAPGAVGRVEYGYVFQSDDLQSPDTLLNVSNYIEIDPGPAAFVGQDKLESRFTCPAPPSINDYKCVAALVRCRTGEEVQGTGLVWLDNLKLERFGTDSTFSDWLPPDSVQTWTLSPGDGRKTVWLAVQDVSGNETRVETCDSINLDETPPVAAIVEPTEGSKVNGEFKLLGAAYDPLVAGDTWFL